MTFENPHKIFFILEAAGICGFFDAYVFIDHKTLGKLDPHLIEVLRDRHAGLLPDCLLYTSDAADEL